MSPPLECFGHVFARSPALAREIRIVNSHCRVAHGKIWIKSDGTLMVRQGCGGAFLVKSPSAKAVCLQSFEREVVACSSGTSNLCTVASDSPNSPAQLGCRLAQRVQHFFLRRRRHLIVRQRISVLAIHCLQFKYILATQACVRRGTRALLRRGGKATSPERYRDASLGSKYVLELKAVNCRTEIRWRTIR